MKRHSLLFVCAVIGLSAAYQANAQTFDLDRLNSNTCEMALARELREKALPVVTTKIETPDKTQLLGFSGRVVTPGGEGLAGMTVVLMTVNESDTRTATTDARGNYSFDNITPDQAYFVSVQSEPLLFNSRQRLIILKNNLARVDFIAEL